MKAIILAILAGLCWGIGEVMTKSALHSKQLGPISALTIRATVALPVLWLVYYFSLYVFKIESANWYAQTSTTNLLKVIIGSGFIAGALAMVFFYLALSFGEISRVKPIAFSLAPLVAVILSFLFLGEPLTIKKIVALVFIVVGIILLSIK